MDSSLRSEGARGLSEESTHRLMSFLTQQPTWCGFETILDVDKLIMEVLYR